MVKFLFPLEKPRKFWLVFIRIFCGAPLLICICRWQVHRSPEFVPGLPAMEDWQNGGGGVQSRGRPPQSQ